jgi:hypothetical protein
MQDLLWTDPNSPCLPEGLKPEFLLVPGAARVEAAPLSKHDETSDLRSLKGRSMIVVRTAEAAVPTWIVALLTKIPTSPKIREKWGTLGRQDLVHCHPENIVLTHT